MSFCEKDIYLLPGNHATAQKLIVLEPVQTELIVPHEEQDWHGILYSYEKKSVSSVVAAAMEITDAVSTSTL